MKPLPGILGEIEDFVSRETALKIASAYGGQRVNIPPRAVDGHWLTELLGFEDADEVCRALCIEGADGRARSIQNEVIPFGPEAPQLKKKRVFERLLAEGKTTREAARLAGIHERIAWRWRAAMKRKGMQVDAR